jgi:hypothetical protein
LRGWGNTPAVLRALNSKEKINKGAGSEAFLAVTKIQKTSTIKTDQHGITPCWSVLYSAYFSGASGVVGVGSTGALP